MSSKFTKVSYETNIITNKTLEHEVIMIDINDIHEYFIPATKSVLGAGSPSRGAETIITMFEIPLGIAVLDPYMSRSSAHDRPLSDYWRDVFTKMAGPHGKTIFQALVAKRSRTHDEG